MRYGAIFFFFGGGLSGHLDFIRYVGKLQLGDPILTRRQRDLLIIALVNCYAT